MREFAVVVARVSGSSMLGRRGVTGLSKSWLGPKFSRTLDTLSVTVTANSSLSQVTRCDADSHCHSELVTVNRSRALARTAVSAMRESFDVASF